jgi:hypothetical protein
MRYLQIAAEKPSRHRREIQQLMEELASGRSASAPVRPAPRGSASRLQNEVPVSQVPNEIIVKLYEDALRREPNNRRTRRAYAEQCRLRRLPCAKVQYSILVQTDPADLEAKRILDGL